MTDDGKITDIEELKENECESFSNDVSMSFVKKNESESVSDDYVLSETDEIVYSEKETPFNRPVTESAFSQEDVSDDEDVSWSAVSGLPFLSQISEKGIDFTGKNLEGGKFSGENLSHSTFSVANLSHVDFSNCNLQGVDFSGANMTEANLSGADLTGAVLSGTVLKNANFTKAILKGVRLNEADIEGALLLDVEIDDLGIEELQELVEYLAKYYPHKLNLARINLTLLDLSKIDLSKVSLRGVDFTGCDFTGVSLVGLDLSECKITPEQIAQALGRMPNPQELAKLLAPKKRPGKKLNIDLEGLFFGRGRFGEIDTTKHKGITVEQLLKVGKKVFRGGAAKPPLKEADVVDHIRHEHEAEIKSHNADLRVAIEARKKEMLAQMEQQKRDEYVAPSDSQRDDDKQKAVEEHKREVQMRLREERLQEQQDNMNKLEMEHVHHALGRSRDRG